MPEWAVLRRRTAGAARGEVSRRWAPESDRTQSGARDEVIYRGDDWLPVTCDLRVMSPTSYQTAPPRVVSKGAGRNAE